MWLGSAGRGQKTVSLTGCFTIPFLSFPFCHFSIILGISVRQALFLKLPLFHGFLYFMISTSSSSVEQTEVETWGNQAAGDMLTAGRRPWDLHDLLVLWKVSKDLWWEKKESCGSTRGNSGAHGHTSGVFKTGIILRCGELTLERGEAARLLQAVNKLILFFWSTAWSWASLSSCVCVSCLSAAVCFSKVRWCEMWLLHQNSHPQTDNLLHLPVTLPVWHVVSANSFL